MASTGEVTEADETSATPRSLPGISLLAPLSRKAYTSSMEAPTRVRRWGTATSNVVRMLAIQGHPTTQVALAAAAHVTQPRISQVYRLLESAGIDPGAVASPDVREQLAGLYVRHHRPAVVAETFWFGLEPARSQGHRAVDRATTVGARPVVSADLGPDLVAPWRTPTLTVVYTASLVDLEPAGFVPAMGRGDATIVIRAVSDGTLLEPWEIGGTDSLPLAHPLQQIWDLHDLGGEDRDEAARRFLAAIGSSRDGVPEVAS